MRLEIESGLPPGRWMALGDEMEARVSRALKDGSTHQLADAWVRVRAGGQPMSVQGNLVTVRVIDCWHVTSSDDWRAAVKVVHIDLPEFLHRNSARGRTHDPRARMRTEEGGEPEPVRKEDQTELTRRASEHCQVLKAEEHDRQEARRLTARIRDLKARARKENLDSTPEIRRVQKALDDLERRLDHAA